MTINQDERYHLEDEEWDRNRAKRDRLEECGRDAEVKCPDCDGHGWYAHQHGEGDIEQCQCYRCNGTGKEKKQCGSNENNP